MAQIYLPIFKQLNPKYKDVPDDVLAKSLTDIGDEVIDKPLSTNPDEEPAAEDGDIVRGFKNDIKQLPATGYGLLGIGAATGEHVFGEGGLWTGAKNAAFDKYKEKQQDIVSKPTDDWDYSLAQAKEGNPGALVDFVQYGIGHAISQLGQAAITGLGGAAAAKALTSKYAGEMVMQAIANETAKLTAANMAADEAAIQATKIVANKVAQAGATGAMLASATAQEGGEIGGGLLEKEKERGYRLSGDELAKGLAYTIGAGGLEFLGDKLGLSAVTGKLGFGQSSRLGRSALGSLAAAPGEAATEYGQTMLEEAGKGNDPTSPESQAIARTSTAMGFIGGGFAGGVGGLMSPKKDQPSPLGDQIQQDETPQEQPAPTVNDITAAPTLDDAVKALDNVVSAPAETNVNLGETAYNDDYEFKGKLNPNLTEALNLGRATAQQIQDELKSVNTMLDLAQNADFGQDMVDSLSNEKQQLESQLQGIQPEGIDNKQVNPDETRIDVPGQSTTEPTNAEPSTGGITETSFEQPEQDTRDVIDAAIDETNKPLPERGTVSNNALETPNDIISTVGNELPIENATQPIQDVGGIEAGQSEIAKPVAPQAEGQNEPTENKSAPKVSVDIPSNLNPLVREAIHAEVIGEQPSDTALKAKNSLVMNMKGGKKVAEYRNQVKEHLKSTGQAIFSTNTPSGYFATKSGIERYLASKKLNANDYDIINKGNTSDNKGQFFALKRRDNNNESTQESVLPQEKSSTIPVQETTQTPTLSTENVEKVGATQFDNGKITNEQGKATQTETRNPVVHEHDNLLTAIAKLGGLKASEAEAQGIDPASFKIKGHKIARVFVKNGKSSKSYDEMAEVLRGYGYDIPTANDLVAKVSESVNQGNHFYTPSGYENQAKIQAENKYNEEQTRHHLRIQDLYRLAEQAGEVDSKGDSYVKSLHKLIDDGKLNSTDEIQAWEEDLNDIIATANDRNKQESESGLRNYSEAELKNRAEEEKRREQREKESSARDEVTRKDQASGVDVFDEMMGNVPGTNDVFGMTNPMQKVERAEKPKPVRQETNNETVSNNEINDIQNNRTDVPVSDKELSAKYINREGGEFIRSKRDNNSLALEEQEVSNTGVDDSLDYKVRLAQENASTYPKNTGNINIYTPDISSHITNKGKHNRLLVFGYNGGINIREDYQGLPFSTEQDRMRAATNEEQRLHDKGLKLNMKNVFNDNGSVWYEYSVDRTKKNKQNNETISNKENVQDKKQIKNHDPELYAKMEHIRKVGYVDLLTDPEKSFEITANTSQEEIDKHLKDGKIVFKC